MPSAASVYERIASYKPRAVALVANAMESNRAHEVMSAGKTPGGLLNT